MYEAEPLQSSNQGKFFFYYEPYVLSPSFYSSMSSDSTIQMLETGKWNKDKDMKISPVNKIFLQKSNTEKKQLSH